MKGNQSVGDVWLPQCGHVRCRAPNASTGSHGSGDSGHTDSQTASTDQVRSLSVPALGISSMRLGGTEEGRRDGDRGSLARRPPRDLHVPHRPPAMLELTGTRVGAEESTAAGWGALGLFVNSFAKRSTADCLLSFKTAQDVTLLSRWKTSNAKVGSDNCSYERIIGQHGLGGINDNGERFAYSLMVYEQPGYRRKCLPLQKFTQGKLGIAWPVSRERDGHCMHR